MLSLRYPKTSRILKSRSFRIVGRYGQKRQGQLLRLQILPEKSSHHRGRRLGISVSKKYGGAVQRNRFKRQVREAFRLSQHKLPKNISVNVAPKGPPPKNGYDFTDLEKELIVLLNPVQKTEV